MTTPSPLAGAPPPVDPGNPAASEEVDIPALAGPPLTQQVAQSTDAAASSMPAAAAKQPGAWSRALVAGVQDALSGFGAGGKTPPGAGGLYGVGAAARQGQAVQAQRQERQDKLNQQNTENQRAQTAQDQKAALDKATIAHENVLTTHDQMLNAKLGYDAQQQNITSGKAAIAPYQTAGAATIQDGLDSDAAQNLIKEKKLNPTQQHAFATGEKPVLDANGKEQMDAEGHVLTRPTYTVVGDVPEVTLDDATAKLISENTPYKLTPGTKLGGIAYGTIIQQALSAQTATSAINQSRLDTKIKALDSQEKLDSLAMLPDWNTALAKTGNDPLKALQYMETNPQLKSKYPNAATTVQSLYGGPDKWQGMVDKQQDERDKVRDFQLREADQQIEKANAAAAKSSQAQTKAEEPITKIWTDPQRGFSHALAQAEQTQNSIQAGADGKGLMTSLVPTMEVLGINSAAGINRIQPQEARAAGAPGGWAEQWNAWADKAAKGKLSPQVAQEGRELMNIVINAHHKAAVQSSQMIAANAQLDPAAVYVMDRNGNQATLKSQIQAYNPTPQSHIFNSQAWAAANPGKNVQAAIAAAKAQGYQVQ